ncbi:hypothetical protein V8C86DRAFT_1341349 [Haematococcus lacustris]
MEGEQAGRPLQVQGPPGAPYPDPPPPHSPSPSRPPSPLPAASLPRAFSAGAGSVSIRVRGGPGAGQAREGGGPVGVIRDRAGAQLALRHLAISHYLTCEQLMELLELLPPDALSERVELVTSWWARLTDRRLHFIDVLRCMHKEQQVRLTQRLGCLNIFNPRRPALHYRLRMWRADEHELAWQLFNLAIASPTPCFKLFHIDGVAKKINEGPNLWPVLRGSAREGSTPTCTIEFDFDMADRPPPKSKSEPKGAVRPPSEAVSMAGLTAGHAASTEALPLSPQPHGDQVPTYRYPPAGGPWMASSTHPFPAPGTMPQVTLPPGE